MDQTQYTLKTPKLQKLHKKNLLPSIAQENITNKISLHGPPDLNSKHTIIRIFNLQDPYIVYLSRKVTFKKAFFQTNKR